MKIKKILFCFCLLGMITKTSIAHAQQSYYQCWLNKKLLFPEVPSKIVYSFNIYFDPQDGPINFESLVFNDLVNDDSLKLGIWCSTFDRPFEGQMDKYIQCGYFGQSIDQQRHVYQNLYTLWGVLGGFSILRQTKGIDGREIELNLNCDVVRE